MATGDQRPSSAARPVVVESGSLYGSLDVAVAEGRLEGSDPGRCGIIVHGCLPIGALATRVRSMASPSGRWRTTSPSCSTTRPWPAPGGDEVVCELALC